jgi:ApbE superfamily uncharacterized protein (UPF0280 family)
VTHILTATPTRGIGGSTSALEEGVLREGLHAAVAIAKDATLADVAATLVGNAAGCRKPGLW